METDEKLDASRMKSRQKLQHEQPSSNDELDLHGYVLGSTAAQGEIEVRERLLRFLREHQVLTLAVTEADGSAYAAALFYAVDDELGFHVVTDPATRHGQAMLANPSVAGTIQGDRQEWDEIQGVQFRGLCQQLSGAAQAAGWQIYRRRFPFLQHPDSILTQELANTEMWRIEPMWIRLIDNRTGFGHKEEWTRPTR